MENPGDDQKAEVEAEDEMGDAEDEAVGAASAPAVESEVNQERW